MAISARIDELKKKFDENPRRYFAPLANEYRKAGDPAQAISICEAYLPQQPGHMSGHIVFGQALYDLNRLDEARSVFETALSLDPENLIALRHLGDIARQTGDASSARGWYQRVLEADPRNDEIAHIILSLAPVPAASAPQASVEPTTEASSVPDMHPLDLPQLGEHVPRGLHAEGIIEVEHFSAAILPLASVLPPSILPPPIVSPPELSRDHALFDLAEATQAEVETAGATPPPPAESPPRPASLAGLESSLTAQSTLDDYGVISSVHEMFELEMQPAATPPDAHSAEPPRDYGPPSAPVEEDEGHLDGAFLDDLVFETFSLGTPVPPEEPAWAIETEPPMAPTQSASVRTPSDASADQANEGPPPLPFVEMTLADAISSSDDVPTTSQAAIEHPEPASPAPADQSETAQPDVGRPPDQPPEAAVSDASARGGASADMAGAAEPGHVATPAPEMAPDDTPTSHFGATPEAIAPTPESILLEATAPEASSSEAPTSDVIAVADEPPAQFAAEAFVTETMADLYLQQGHLEPALDIYRKLVEQRPDDRQLRERLGAIERRVFGTPARPVVEQHIAAAGPTIREFLAVFAAVNVDRGGSQEEHHDEQISGEPQANGHAAAEAGGIDALFPGSDAAISDANAATALADAFAPNDGRDVPPLFEQAVSAAAPPHHESQASRPASDAHHDAADDGFSFDQFFSGDVHSPVPTAPRDVEAAPGDAADVEQFNQWLSGLKKLS